MMTAWDRETFRRVAAYQARSMLGGQIVDEYPDTLERSKEGMARLVQAHAALQGVTIERDDLLWLFERDEALLDLRCRWWPAEPAAVLNAGPLDGLDLQVVTPAPVLLQVVDGDLAARYRVESWDPDVRRWVYEPAPADAVGVTV